MVELVKLTLLHFNLVLEWMKFLLQWSKWGHKTLMVHLLCIDVLLHLLLLLIDPIVLSPDLSYVISHWKKPNLSSLVGRLTEVILLILNSGISLGLHFLLFLFMCIRQFLLYLLKLLFHAVVMGLNDVEFLFQLSGNIKNIITYRGSFSLLGPPLNYSFVLCVVMNCSLINYFMSNSYSSCFLRCVVIISSSFQSEALALFVGGVFEKDLLFMIK